MVTKKVQKKKINLLTLLTLVVTLSLFVLYIVISSMAGYVITDSFSADLPNYYMRVTEPKVKEFEDSPIETSFIVHNNDGKDFMTEDLEYSISIKENEKWDISVEGGMERKITGGSMSLDEISAIITPKSDVEIGIYEIITIVLTAKSPYPDEKIIELVCTDIPEPIISVSTEINNFSYSASELSSTSGNISGNSVVINPNETQYGPYKPLDKGTYKVTVTGTNLSNVRVDSCGSIGAVIYPISNIEKTSTKITYIVTIPEANPSVEFRVFTDSSTTATVSDIEVESALKNNGWYPNNVIVEIDKNTTLGNIKTQYQLVTNGKTGEWIDYTGAFTIETEGITKINVKNVYIPVEGAEKSGKSEIVRIDKTPPENLSFEISDITSIKATLGGETTDTGGSGIAGYYFSKDNGDTWVGPQTASSYTFTNLTPNTTYTMKMKVTDNAGNMTIAESKQCTTLEANRIETFTLTYLLSECEQYEVTNSGVNNSSGTISQSIVSATADKGGLLTETARTVIAGYKGTVLKDKVENYVNSNYLGWSEYSVDTKLTLQINIDLGSASSSDTRCGTWVSGQAQNLTNLWNGSGSSGGTRNVANLYNIYSWNSTQTPSDFLIGIYVRKDAWWSGARTIKYSPQDGNAYVTLEVTVTIPNL